MASKIEDPRFVSKVIMFEEVLEFKKAIILCYGRKKTIAL